MPRLLLAAVLLLTTPNLALALPNFLRFGTARATAEPRVPAPEQAAGRSTTARGTHGANPPATLSRAERRQVARGYLSERTESLRSAARFFRKITVEHNYAGEHVLFRDPRVTAFLDITDPSHPRFNPEHEVDPELASIPAARRAHVIVVPNTPREHIGARLGGTIGLSDLRETTAVLEAAERLAGQLNIRTPRVFINAESAIGVGYLHVHIVGERTVAYPAPLAPPSAP